MPDIDEFNPIFEPVETAMNFPGFKGKTIKKVTVQSYPEPPSPKHEAAFSEFENSLRRRTLSNTMLRKCFALNSSVTLNLISKHMGNDTIFPCIKCKEITFSSLSGHAYLITKLCAECLSKDYKMCEQCNSFILKDDGGKFHVHGENMLKGIKTTSLHSFNTDITQISGAKLALSGESAPKRYIGIEVEFEYRIDKPIPPDVLARALMAIGGIGIAKKDGSLSAAPGSIKGTNGFEIVSVPATYRYHCNLQGWSDLFEAVQNWVQPYPPTTGLHFHVDSSVVSDRHIANVVYFINSWENFPFNKAIADRDFTLPSPTTGIVYANPGEPYKKVLEVVQKKVHKGGCAMHASNKKLRGYYWSSKTKGFEYDGFGHMIIQRLTPNIQPVLCGCPKKFAYDDHYHALNLKTKGGHTFEFRIFRGSSNFSHFRACLDYVDALINFCHLRSLDQLKWQNFMTWFNDGMRRQYPYLTKWLIQTNYITQRPRKDL